MQGKLKYYLILNITVFVWGFTGVLGKEISVNASQLVFFRTGIAFLSLLLIGLFYKKEKKLNKKQFLSVLLTGIVVGLHWFTFFHAIKISTVSIAVVCMSSSTLFTALIEPLVFKRKVLFSEIVMSIIIVVGIGLIVGFEFQYINGILFGLISAFLASLFSVLNGKFIRTISSFKITKYEMLGGLITVAIMLGFSGEWTPDLFMISQRDWFYLLLLGTVCTSIAFLVSVWLMKNLSPFTVSMGINMEPIYAILIVLFLDYLREIDSEKMSFGFYFGGLIIISSIFLNAYLKKRQKVKLNSNA